MYEIIHKKLKIQTDKTFCYPYDVIQFLFVGITTGMALRGRFT